MLQKITCSSSSLTNIVIVIVIVIVFVIVIVDKVIKREDEIILSTIFNLLVFVVACVRVPVFVFLLVIK